MVVPVALLVGVIAVGVAGHRSEDAAGSGAGIAGAVGPSVSAAAAASAPVVARATPSQSASSLNRFTIDDVLTAWSPLDSTPPWVRRLDGLANDRSDPFDR